MDGEKCNLGYQLKIASYDVEDDENTKRREKDKKFQTKIGK